MTVNYVLVQYVDAKITKGIHKLTVCPSLFQTSLCNYCRPPTNELSLGVCIAMFSAAVTSIVIIVLSLRWFGKVAFF